MAGTPPGLNNPAHTGACDLVFVVTPKAGASRHCRAVADTIGDGAALPLWSQANHDVFDWSQAP
jgi:hypothetical protein